MIIAKFWSESCELYYLWIPRKFNGEKEIEEVIEKYLPKDDYPIYFEDYIEFQEPIELPQNSPQEI